MTFDYEALSLDHGRVNGEYHPKDDQGFCIEWMGGRCRRCEAEKQLKRPGFDRVRRPSRISKLLHELADLL